MTRLLSSAIVAFLVLSACAARMPLRVYYMPAVSMSPTIPVRSEMLVAETAYEFQQPMDGDIVVFAPPFPAPSWLVKRVIAGPGESLRIERGIVYVNGRRLKEAYIGQRATYSMEVRDYAIYVNEGNGWAKLDSAVANLPPRKEWTAPDRIPPHCYIVLGDNRNYSEDSHIWGFAQDRGKFWSGFLAGKYASIFGKVVKVF